MNIRRQIAMLNALWLFGLLLIVDLLIYSLFIRVAIHNEEDTLLTKTDYMVNELGVEQLLRPGREKQMVKYLPTKALIRIVDSESKVINQLDNDPELAIIPPQFTERKETFVDKSDGERLLMVRRPITTAAGKRGTIEFAELMEALKANTSMLVIVLIFTTALAVFMSMLGGTFVANVILRPITAVIRTMKEVEASLAFRQIPPPGNHKDELYELTMTFNRMLGRIEESLRMRQQFVSDASHELKTALTIIEGYSGLLRRWGSEDEAIRKEAVETIHRETIRLKKMTQQMLNLSMLERAEKLEMERFDLVRLCRQVARPFQLFRKREVEIAVAEGMGSELYVTADAHHIQQLLMILLDNAFKYSQAPVRLEIEKEPEYAAVRVRDFGIGIPETEMEQVFERFYRVDKARHRKTGGSGLGLSIAHTIVERHHGSIEIASKEGEGTAVTIRLPLEPAQGGPIDEGSK